MLRRQSGDLFALVGEERAAADVENRLTPVLLHQYSRIATSKYQVRRISITSNSAARPGGNTW